MKKKVYAIHDSKIEAFMQPFVMHTAGEALRGFAELANDPQTNISKHPTDFTLFELGEYDEKSGALIPHATPMALGLAVQYKKGDNVTALKS